LDIELNGKKIIKHK